MEKKQIIFAGIIVLITCLVMLIPQKEGEKSDVKARSGQREGVEEPKFISEHAFVTAPSVEPRELRKYRIEKFTPMMRKIASEFYHHSETRDVIRAINARFQKTTLTFEIWPTSGTLSALATAKKEMKNGKESWRIIFFYEDLMKMKIDSRHHEGTFEMIVALTLFHEWYHLIHHIHPDKKHFSQEMKIQQEREAWEYHLSLLDIFLRKGMMKTFMDIPEFHTWKKIFRLYEKSDRNFSSTTWKDNFAKALFE